MKNLIHILFFLSLFLITAFPQDRINRAVIPEELTAKRILELLQSNAGELPELHDRESILSKSKNSNWQTASGNLQREFYEEEGFDIEDTRTTINKTLLSNGFLLVEIIWQTWNGSAWVNSYKYSYTYDGNDNLAEYLLQNWVGSAWVNLSRRSYTYDGNNNLIEEIGQSWDGSAWVNSLRQSYTYDGNNNETEYLRENWNGSDWVNFSKWLYTYDGNNNRIGDIYQTWDISVWVNRENYTYTYVNNNLTEFLFQNWNGIAWENWDKYTYTYAGNNKLTELAQRWDGSAWGNISRRSYTYDVNNNLIEERMESWDGSGWVNYSMFSSAYNLNNNLIEEIYQTWGGSTWGNVSRLSYTYVNNNETEYLRENWNVSVWVNFSKWSYTYDGNNNPFEDFYQTWNGSVWVNVNKYVYSYIPTQQTITTTLTMNAPAGSQVLEVLSTNGFSIGDNIVINPGGSTEETNTITGFGSILLQTSLQFDHNSGEVVELIITSVEDNPGLVANEYTLSQNFPNPFNPTTRIRWQSPVSSQQSLKIYDVLGNELATLVNEFKPAGKYEVTFDASGLPSGIYFYQMQIGSFIETRKMVVLK